MLTGYFANGGLMAALKELDGTQYSLNRVFNDTSRMREFPPLNVYSGEGKYCITAEIPGIDPKKVEIILSEDTITIKGNREPEKDPEDIVWYRRERVFGGFSRSIRLPFKVEESGISAKAVNGVLRLEITKPAAQKPVKVPVKMA